LYKQGWKEVSYIGTGQKSRRTLKPQSFQVSQNFKFETAEEIDDNEIEDRYSPESPFDDNRDPEHKTRNIIRKPSELSKVNTRTTRSRL
jgi:hypothetical protein